MPSDFLSPSFRIISGGQTGVDRAALQVAIDLGISHGGWCPRGRRAEDGRIPDRFQLREVDSADYSVRTLRNIDDADGTLILHSGRLTGGTALTETSARQQNKPLLLVDLDCDLNPIEVRQWIESHKIAMLNVAGPRESTSPGIYNRAMKFLRSVLENV
jgi:hypothetical protein